ncbi:MAG TPA: hypothetical protein VGH43_10020 [Jatrophihabitans sp.]|jgi:hypothetical protein
MPASPRDDVTASCEEPHQLLGLPRLVYVPACAPEDDPVGVGDVEVGAADVLDVDDGDLLCVGTDEERGRLDRVLGCGLLGAAVLVSGDGAPAPVPCPGEDVVQPATTASVASARASAPLATRIGPGVLRSAQ